MPQHSFNENLTVIPSSPSFHLQDLCLHMLQLISSQPAATLNRYWARHWACAVDMMELLVTCSPADQAAEWDGQPGGAGVGQAAAMAGQAVGVGQAAVEAADTFGTVKGLLSRLMTNTAPFSQGECVHTSMSPLLSDLPDVWDDRLGVTGMRVPCFGAGRAFRHVAVTIHYVPSYCTDTLRARTGRGCPVSDPPSGPD